MVAGDGVRRLRRAVGRSQGCASGGADAAASAQCRMPSSRLRPCRPSTSRRHRGRPQSLRRILGIGLRLFCILRIPPTTSTSTTTQMNKSTTPKTTVSNLHVDEKESSEEQIARRAHELWQQRGHEYGNDLTDWFQAEREINEWHQRRLKKD